MSLPADDVVRIKELAEAGESACEIERHTGIPRSSVRCILGKTRRYIPIVNNDLSVRQRQQLLNWRAA